MSTMMIMKSKVARSLQMPGRLYSRAVRSRRKARFAKILGFGRDEIERYTAELEATKIRERLNLAKKEFAAAIEDRFAPPDLVQSGGIGYRQAVILYCIVRKIMPDTVVETGVCNGLSSASILSAMQMNQSGRLYSIDLPQMLDECEKRGSGAPVLDGGVIASGREPGWLVPEYLRDRWDLRLGKTQHLLPALLEELGTIDMFLHDSEHSYECMTFEYNQAYPRLRPGGVLVSDDVKWNKAFSDFVRTHSGVSTLITNKLGLFRK